MYILGPVIAFYIIIVFVIHFYNERTLHEEHPVSPRNTDRDREEQAPLIVTEEVTAIRQRNIMEEWDMV